MSKYIDEHVRWQERQWGKWTRALFIVTFPAIFIAFFVLGPGWLASRRFVVPVGLGLGVRLVLGGMLAVLGGALYLWTITLFAKARGTQVPQVPTQALVTTGPYAVSRNPMVTSAIVMVLGAGVLVDSWSFLAAGLGIPSFYLVYIKLVEEKELEARFGEAYVAYKKSTPFIVPRLSGRGRER